MVGFATNVLKVEGGGGGGSELTYFCMRKLICMCYRIKPPKYTSLPHLQYTHLGGSPLVEGVAPCKSVVGLVPVGPSLLVPSLLLPAKIDMSMCNAAAKTLTAHAQ